MQGKILKSQLTIQDSEDAWRQLLAILTLVARHDPRPAVADAAAAALMQVIKTHSHEWQANVWSTALAKGIAYLLDFPKPHANLDTPVVRPACLSRLSVGQACFRSLSIHRRLQTNGAQCEFEHLDVSDNFLHSVFKSLRRNSCKWSSVGGRLQVGWSIEGGARVSRHASTHLPDFLQAVSDNFESASVVFQPVSPPVTESNAA